MQANNNFQCDRKYRGWKRPGERELQLGTESVRRDFAVSLRVHRLLQSFRVERIKTKGQFKKMIQKNSWNWMKQKAKSKCTRAILLLAQWITGYHCLEAVNSASNTKLLCSASQQSGYRQGPYIQPSHYPEHEPLASTNSPAKDLQVSCDVSHSWGRGGFEI